MTVVTTDTIQGKVVIQTLCLCTGSSVNERFASREDVAQGVSSGKTLDRSRDEALDDMVAMAVRLGANAVIGVRLESSLLVDDVVGETAHLLAYGTAVVVRNEWENERLSDVPPSSRG